MYIDDLKKLIKEIEKAVQGNEKWITYEDYNLKKKLTRLPEEAPYAIKNKLKQTDKQIINPYYYPNFNNQHNITQPIVQNTTSQPIVQNTASQPIVQNTTSHPIVQNTASQPIVQNTTSQPIVQNTTSQPIVQNTASRPIVQNTASQPDVGNTTTYSRRNYSNSFPQNIKNFADKIDKLTTNMEKLNKNLSDI
jgi:hypothetical protein